LKRLYLFSTILLGLVTFQSISAALCVTFVQREPNFPAAKMTNKHKFGMGFLEKDYFTKRGENIISFVPKITTI